MNKSDVLNNEEYRMRYECNIFNVALYSTNMIIALCFFLGGFNNYNNEEWSNGKMILFTKSCVIIPYEIMTFMNAFHFIRNR